MNRRKLLSYIVGPVGGAFIALITLPLITRYFNAEDIGRFSLLQVAMSLGVMVISLGLYQSYVREYHEYDEKSIILKMIFLPTVIFFLCVSLFLYLLDFDLFNFVFSMRNSIYSSLFFVSIFISTIINQLAHILRMEERALAFSLTQVIPKLSILITILGMVFYSEFDGFDVLLISNFLSQVISLIVFLFLTKKNWSFLLKVNNDFKLMFDMLKFSLPLIFGSLAYWGLTALDRFFIKTYSSLNELGVYAVASSFAAVASIIASVFSNIWHPLIYRWIKEGVDKHLINYVMNVTSLAVAMLWSAAGCCAWLISYIMPSEYQDAEYIFWGCIAMPFLYLISETTQVGIGITRRSGFSMLASVLSLVVNVAANMYLVPLIGARGAAISTVLSFFVFFVIRTEASAYLWYNFKRAKIYIVVVFYSVFSIAMQIIPISRLSYIIFSILLFSFCVFLFYKEIPVIFKKCVIFITSKG